ncbi:MAG: CheB methylesterase domain-containing protein, partial [Proteobacteria bacterium]|nr:CheB methylesterase domain-containing protein [Pseudomonadota bacterium]
ASSTGGPAALEVVVSKLHGRVPRIPVLLVQHMPESFTRNLASRLTDLSGVEVREATNGEPVKPGALILAPGNFHMRLNRNGDCNYITLDQGPKVNSVRPAADLLFISAAQLYGPSCAGMVLTGMGEDGCTGAKAIKQAGGGIMIQDRDSSIVWGMPAAVEKAGAYDLIGDLNACADQLANFCYGHDKVLLKKSS